MPELELEDDIINKTLALDPVSIPANNPKDD